MISGSLFFNFSVREMILSFKSVSCFWSGAKGSFFWIGEAWSKVLANPSLGAGSSFLIMDSSLGLREASGVISSSDFLDVWAKGAKKLTHTAKAINITLIIPAQKYVKSFIFNLLRISFIVNSR